MFKIDSHIPIPERKIHQRLPTTSLDLPWGLMKIGDSFFVGADGHDVLRLINKITGSANGHFGAGKVSARTVIEDGELGVRAWRIS